MKFASRPGTTDFFLLEFQSPASNNVEVAIGRDADEDGCLSLDETDLAVGYDCGRSTEMRRTGFGITLQ